MEFLESTRKSKVMHTDNSLEFDKACEDLSWKKLQIDTTQIGNKWDDLKSSTQSKRRYLCCICYNQVWMKIDGQISWKIYDLMGRSPYERRFGQSLQGPIIPFDSLNEYHPFITKDQSRIHQFGKKVLPGFFLEYLLRAGTIRKDDVQIADLEELETIDVSEIYSKRLNTKE